MSSVAFKKFGWLFSILTGLMLVFQALPGVDVLRGPLQIISRQFEWSEIVSEREDEILVVIAPFSYLGGAVNNRDHLILKELFVKAFTGIGVATQKSMRIEFYTKEIGDESDAKGLIQAGLKKKASIIIWAQVANNRTNFVIYDTALAKSDGDTDYDFRKLSEITYFDGRFLDKSFSLSLPKVSQSINVIIDICIGNIFLADQNFEMADSMYRQALLLLNEKIIAGEKLNAVEAVYFYKLLKASSFIDNIVLDGRRPDYDLIYNAVVRIVENTDTPTVYLQYYLIVDKWIALRQSNNNALLANILDELNAIEGKIRNLNDNYIMASFYAQRGIVKSVIGVGDKGVFDLNKSRQMFEVSVSKKWSLINAITLIYLYIELNNYSVCTSFAENNLVKLADVSAMYKIEYYLILARCQEKSNNSDAALKTVDSALSFATHKRAIGTILHRKANIYHGLGQLEDEAMIRERIVNLNPEFSWDAHNLALFYYNKKNFIKSRDLELLALSHSWFSAAIAVLLQSNIMLDKSAITILGDLGVKIDGKNNLESWKNISWNIVSKAIDDDKGENLLNWLMVAATYINARYNVQYINNINAPRFSEQLMDYYSLIAWSLFNNNKDKLAIAFLEKMIERYPMSVTAKHLGAYFSCWNAYEEALSNSINGVDFWLKKSGYFGFFDVDVLNKIAKIYPDISVAIKTENQLINYSSYTQYVKKSFNNR